METTSPPPKKGLGPLAWIGIGCGGLVVIIVIVTMVAGAMFGPKLKQFAEDASKDPTRATAYATVNMSAGQMEIVAEDAPNKRYTLKQKASGQLITIYWDAKQGKPVTVNGDFSAIPANANSPGAPAASGTPPPN